MRRISKLDVRFLVAYLYKDSILPEFLDILGEKKTMEILRTFGGMRIFIPPYKKVLDLRRNIDVYETLSYVNSKETIKTLAEKYDVTEVWVREVYKLMRRMYPKILDSIEKFEKESPITITTHREAKYEKIKEEVDCREREDTEEV